MTKRGDARAKAWATRRAKYGARGHGGSYSRGPTRGTGPRPSCDACQRTQYLLISLHVDGVLSEGQVAKATGLDRVAIRELADTMKED